ncbi:enoyl-CoA hydratase/isomerase family protein [soil metagenome]
MVTTYETLRLAIDGGVATVTFDNPPVNVMTLRLMTELDAVFDQFIADRTIRVIVFESADPEFFLAHGDMTTAADPAEFGALKIALDQKASLNPMMRLHERLRCLPQLTVVKLRGFARGGGAEFVSAADIRYGSEKAGLAQFEAPSGILPGGGGTAYLPRLVGRARALEVVLGCDLVDARTAERWGWLNRVVTDDQLDNFVTSFARRVALLPDGVLHAVFDAIQPDSSIAPALDAANDSLGQLFAKPAAAIRARALLDAGAQTRDGERHLETLVKGLDAAPDCGSASNAGARPLLAKH